MEEPLYRLYRRWRPLSPEGERDRRDLEHLRVGLAFSLPATANCIDVGAHTGQVLRDIVRIAPLGRHIAYEPLPHLCAELRREFPAVEIRNVALSRTSAESPFIFVASDPGYSGLRERTYPRPEQLETIQVTTERLDDSLDPGYVPAFIKVDVEGAEKWVFEGALETISRHKPIVFFEHGRGAAGGKSR